MAGDWIKIRTALARDGRLLIALRKCHAESVTNVTQESRLCHLPVTMMGALVTLWCHADQHADEEGVLVGYGPDDIDAMLSLPGFCRSLPPDWMNFTSEGWVQLPEYHKHNGDSAKKRSQAADRKRSQRQRDNSHDESVTDVTQESQPCLEKVTPREEKRRVQTPIVPKGTEDPLLDRAKSLLGIRSSTRLDSGQTTAWKKNKAAVADSTEEDWLALEWWFRQRNEKGDVAEYRRTTLGALLNHWSDEVVKARRGAVKVGASFLPPKKKKAAEIPADWKGMLTAMDPEYNAPDRFEELPESIRHMLLAEFEKKKGEQDGR